MQARGQWRVPSVTPSVSPDPRSTSVAWVGIGSGDSPSTPLIQAGIAIDVFSDYGVQYKFFWEVFPQTALQGISYPQLYADDEVYVFVQYARARLAAGPAQFLLCKRPESDDEWECVDLREIEPGLSPPDNQAEWIVERPLVDGMFLKQVEYGSFEFHDIRSQQEKIPFNTGYVDCSNLANCSGVTAYDMRDGGTTYASTDPLGSDGSFSVRHRNS